EVYDSGRTTHMTPYRSSLENYTNISQKSFWAVNKQDFQAVRKGDLMVEVPNG
ncbi:hypothetical protein K439DRAFT_1258891, partial [Ramaria rubella]